MISKASDFLSLIKFSHTIFALPFAVLGYVIGLQALDLELDILLLIKVLLCMVFARSAAMAFNRWLDKDIDGHNPRTAIRELPSGIITPSAALAFVIVNCAAFIATTYFINPICFYLSPVALLVILGYSWTKRFTALCHFVLGVGLALAPVGAYLAVTGRFDVISVLLGAIVLLWVAGFDIIYALQDESFDRSQGLHSIPEALGRSKALLVSKSLHAGVALLILFVSWLMVNNWDGMYWIIWLATAVFIALLIYQHSIVKEDDLSRVDLAFFTTNGYASLIFCSLVILDFYT